MIEFRMPSMGADMESGTLREWKVKPGDVVKRGDIIAEVEAQKGIIEIECFEEGVIEKLLIEIDQKVPVGTPMALIRTAGEASGAFVVTTAAGTPQQPDITATPEPNAKTPPTVEVQHVSKLTAFPKTEEIPQSPGASVETTVPKEHGLRISPLARRMAEENHIDLNAVHGTGEDGAITKADIEKAILDKTAATATATKPAATGSDTIRQAVAAAMSRSNREIPHYYLESAIDMQAALDWLAKQNTERPVQQRLLLAPVLIKAAAKALRAVPELNAVWDNGLQLKPDIHMGFVVSLRGGGIIVPAIHDADKKSIDELMAAMNDIIPRARALRLRSSELSDSTVTLTSLGEGGADKVFGIIYPPQVAVIGFGAVIQAPAVIDGQLVIRPTMHITLGGDHRATDGLSGSKFLKALKEFLQHPEEL